MRHVLPSNMWKRVTIAVSCLVLTLGGVSSGQAPAPALHWQAWSDAVFANAREQHKFVLLDLEAVWCHWCHVMDEVTYRDPIVMRLLNQRYILVRVDQDSRPDIANRYQEYGWPATIVFAGDGSEIVKRQGYIPPRPMSSMLQAIIDDPSPGPSVEKEVAFRPAASSVLSPTLLARIRSGYEKQYDLHAAGWGFGHKFLDGDSIEYAMRLAGRDDREYTKRINDTLHQAAALLDPVWGGMYQYSVDGRWSEPHFEKLISIQATALRQYSLAYARSRNAEYLLDAESVYRYTAGFLSSPSMGVFYVSQDADLHDGQENESYFRLSDSDRRAKGIPRIDKHVYARENGWMISALCTYFAASGDESSLEQARRAAGWISKHRALPGGGYRHDDTDPAGPYLGDTLGMGQAYLDLYNVTGSPDYLKSAASAGRYIAAHFAPNSRGTGFVTASTRAGIAYKPQPDRDENIALVRFAAALAVATGDEQFHAMSREAMHYLAAKSVALQPLSAGILLANEDATEAPIHITVVGSPLSADTRALHDAALRCVVSHELIEIRDPNSPNSPPTKIIYPGLRRPALFLCTANACSAPVFAADEVRAKIERAQLQGRH